MIMMIAAIAVVVVIVTTGNTIEYMIVVIRQCQCIGIHIGGVPMNDIMGMVVGCFFLFFLFVILRLRLWKKT